MINFDKLPVTIVVKEGMLKVRRNVQRDLTVGPQSNLAKILMTNLMEPLRGIEKVIRSAPKIDKPLTNNVVKNLKRNKHKTKKHRTTPNTPKLALSPALEQVKKTLRRAS